MACTMFRTTRVFPSIFRCSQQLHAAQSSQQILPIVALQNQPHRNSSFRSSPITRDLNEYPEVEVVRNPPEWKFVEKLMAPKMVPTPPLQDGKFASGWKVPQKFHESTAKYYIGRTKNHMIPVYLLKRYRGTRRLTLIRYIQGDIWALEQDVRKVVEKSQGGKKCATRVNEMSGQITIHGDYVSLLLEYLGQQGF